MNVKLRVLSAGALFFLGQAAFAQTTKKDTANATQIEEVVMVGFGQKKTIQEMTGSASVMSAKSIEDIPVASVDKMLQGRVAGVQTGSASGQPGGMTNVRVRGISSLNGVSSPIYIVDGVRVSSGDISKQNTTTNALAGLNPDDIENVTVLKDAVSTAVYGADAGAGVIVITTKSGKKGKAKFNASFNSGFNDRAIKPHASFRSADWKNYLVDAYSNRDKKTYTAAQIAAGAAGATAAGIFRSPNDTDWQGATQKKGYQQNLDINVSGGNEKFTYYTSFNYFNQESVVKGSYFNRLAFTNKIAYQATDKLKISTDFQVSYGKISTLAAGGAFSNPILAQYFNRPTDLARNPDGSLYLGASNGRLSNGNFNPAALQEMNYQRAGTFRAFANLNVEYKILKNLTYRFVFSPEYINMEEEQYWNPLHGDGRAYSGLKQSGVNRFFNFNVQNILDFNYRLDRHNFGASLIQEAYKKDNKYLTATGITVGTPTLQTLENFVVPFGYNGQLDISSRYGYAVTGHYDYDKLVMLDASYRRDILSQFLPGKKAGNFWSVGLGLDVARFDVIKNIEAISLLKFRTSYGKLGNQITANPYATYSYIKNYDDQAAAVINRVFSPNLSWETVNPFNVGFDLGFFKNRLTITAEYYNKKTKDLIYNIPLSAAQGGMDPNETNNPNSNNYVVENIGSLVNRGFEFAVNGDIFRGDRNQFNWSVGFNLSTLHNEVTELYGGNVDTGTQTIRVGEGARTYYLRKWAGVDPSNGDPLWYVNGVDGETTNNYNKAKQAVQGSFLSNVFGGANTSLSYKGFSLDAQFTYGFGGKIFDNWASYLYSDGQYTASYPGYDVTGDYWTPSNTGASNPKPIATNGNKRSNSASTRFLYKGDYIRLSNASLGYTFSSDFLEGTGLNSVKVYVMANNAWTYRFDKNLKYDPETNISGFSDLNLPVLKSFLFGVNLSF
ncbi:SusC/RagA family TonB-linked outer membrane protein [Chryseobacterium jejuense]|uniref:Outer membrane receptor for ferrienterochelin and colicins n=1 Tax=Chryseobacterium jejuense TaxID=445960 RepID=A0A2X2WUS1_CHRJE|nr:SusC/RagA family TonB-linked outer membrane protein [Chryseobacterium jejuense]SDI56832.1 TonB-linked outer membrane protein, SusC/RagA family [Chryseobacterium jejuense]SQB47062.1 Outer membrane receptor for ferrienterochelin and colicins [Chryseobacterium jejuense]